MNPACGSGNSPATLDCFTTTVFPNIIHAAFLLVGVVTVIIIIIAGTKFISSRGDNKQVEGAKKALTYAIIGLSIVLFSYLIINIISYVTGVSCIRSMSFLGCK